MYRLIPILIIALMLIGCPGTLEEPEWNNPTDPDLPTFVEPETIIDNGPLNDAVVNDHTVTFQFSGNENVVEYSWLLNGSDWSDWNTVNSITFDYLDEGDYEFQVKGRYNDIEEDGSPALRVFTIDAVQGPALRFLPRKVIIASDEIFSVDIIAEEVTNLSGMQIIIPLSGGLELINYQLYESGTDFLSKSCNQFLSIVDDTNSEFKAVIGRVSDTLPGVDGTGEIIRLTLKYTGTIDASLTFDNSCELQDPDMNVIPLNETVECVIEVTD